MEKSNVVKPDETNGDSGVASETEIAPDDCGPDGTSYEAMGLTHEQILAMRVIKDGGSAAEAAMAAGVHRGTLFRWISGNGAFQRVHDQWQRSAMMLASDNWKTLAEEAVEAVRQGLKKGNANLGYRVLKTLGLLDVHALDTFAVRKATELRKAAGVVDVPKDDEEEERSPGDTGLAAYERAGTPQRDAQPSSAANATQPTRDPARVGIPASKANPGHVPSKGGWTTGAVAKAAAMAAPTPGWRQTSSAPVDLRDSRATPFRDAGAQMKT